MTVEPVTVGPQCPIRDVAALLARRRISGVPVVDAAGDVVGVVSDVDILASGRSGAPALTAGDAMSSPAVTVAPEQPVSQAAAVTVERRVGRLPVVSGGELVGIVTRSDLVRAFARPDEELEREIREHVLLAPFGIAPEAVVVRVEDGRATLRGEVESEDVADLLVWFVRRVLGVVEVRPELNWPRGAAHVRPRWRALAPR
jgi:CBS domain-containing protein